MRLKMGQQQSIVDDDTPPQVLDERSLAAVADYIKSGQARRIVVLTGAGISTAAGIPDFRSPETGLYSNLARLNLPEPEAVFDLHFFRGNPVPFYVLARELYPGNFHPTVSHVFLSLLASKGLLYQLFTQNIDCLERAAGVPDSLIVEAHGSFATQRCINCRTPYPDDLMRDHVSRAEVPKCRKPLCEGVVKPDIVFFHEGLPEAFFAKRSMAADADLVIVMGTSLTVYPFASLPDEVPDNVPRLLFNLEKVGSLGGRADDVLVLEDCDTGVRKLADALGWREELEAEWRRVVGDEEADRQIQGSKKREAELLAEVERLADRVDDALHLQDGGGDDDEDKAVDEEADRQIQGSKKREADLLAEVERLADRVDDALHLQDGGGDDDEDKAVDDASVVHNVHTYDQAKQTDGDEQGGYEHAEGREQRVITNAQEQHGTDNESRPSPDTRETCGEGSPAGVGTVPKALLEGQGHTTEDAQGETQEEPRGDSETPGAISKATSKNTPGNTTRDAQHEARFDK